MGFVKSSYRAERARANIHVETLRHKMKQAGFEPVPSVNQMYQWGVEGPSRGNPDHRTTVAIAKAIGCKARLLWKKSETDKEKKK